MDGKIYLKVHFSESRMKSEVVEASTLLVCKVCCEEA